jgi:hypothetical protein
MRLTQDPNNEMFGRAKSLFTEAIGQLRHPRKDALSSR